MPYVVAISLQPDMYFYSVFVWLLTIFTFALWPGQALRPAKVQVGLDTSSKGLGLWFGQALALWLTILFIQVKNTVTDQK